LDGTLTVDGEKELEELETENIKTIEEVSDAITTMSESKSRSKG